jgi:hypothetical protein
MADQQTEDSGSKLSKALAAAFERGDVAARAILASDEMLNVDRAAAMMDCSIESLMRSVDQGYLLALRIDDEPLVFPDWQFRYDGQPYDDMAEVLDEFSGSSPWEVYRFMKHQHPALSGRTGVGILKMSREPILREIAKSWIEGAYE